jgi:hypothetical protein
MVGGWLMARRDLGAGDSDVAWLDEAIIRCAEVLEKISNILISEAISSILEILEEMNSIFVDAWISIRLGTGIRDWHGVVLNARGKRKSPGRRVPRAQEESPNHDDEDHVEEKEDQHRQRVELVDGRRVGSGGCISSAKQMHSHDQLTKSGHRAGDWDTIAVIALDPSTTGDALEEELGGKKMIRSHTTDVSMACLVAERALERRLFSGGKKPLVLYRSREITDTVKLAIVSEANLIGIGEVAFLLEGDGVNAEDVGTVFMVTISAPVAHFVVQGVQREILWRLGMLTRINVGRITALVSQVEQVCSFVGFGNLQRIRRLVCCGNFHHCDRNIVVSSRVGTSCRSSWQSRRDGSINRVW